MLSDEVVIVVFGAGLSGLVAAHRLSKVHGNRVIVVEKQRNPVAEHYQGEHLSPSSIRAIAELGYGELLESASLLRLVGTRSFWGGTDYFQDYLVSRGGYGLCISQLKMIDLLRKQCLENRVQFCNGLLSRLKRQENYWLIELQSSGGIKIFRTRFIVDATGRSAHLSRKLSLPRASDRQVAVLCEIDTRPEILVSKHSVVGTSPLGWWYFSPIREFSSVLILHTDQSGGRQVASIKDFFEAAVTIFESKGVNLGAVTSASRFFRCASGLDFLLEPFEARFAAIGDAAFAPDPISSSGIANSFKSACIFAERFLSGSFDCVESLHDWNCQHAALVEEHVSNREYFYRSELRWKESRYWGHQNRSSFVEKTI